MTHIQNILIGIISTLAGFIIGFVVLQFIYLLINKPFLNTNLSNVTIIEWVVLATCSFLGLLSSTFNFEEQ